MPSLFPMVPPTVNFVPDGEKGMDFDFIYPSFSLFGRKKLKNMKGIGIYFHSYSSMITKKNNIIGVSKGLSNNPLSDKI